MTPEEQQQMLQMLGGGMANQAGGQLAGRGSQIDAVVDAALQGQGQMPQQPPGMPPGMPPPGGPGAGMQQMPAAQQQPSPALLSTIIQRLKGLAPAR